jgi:hypothetical protein
LIAREDIMSIITKRFGGFEAELELYTDEDGEERSNCFISVVNGDGSNSSLAMVEGWGFIDGDCGEIPVPQDIVNQIETWAQSNGY